MLKNYVKYLHETLGVTLVPFKPGALIDSVNDHKYSVVFFSQNPFSIEETCLFEKMRSAIGLTEESAPLIFAEKITEYEFEICVSFDAISDFGLLKVGDISQVNNRKYIYLHSPQILIENSQLKKEAWELMKSQIGQSLPKLPLN